MIFCAILMWKMALIICVNTQMNYCPRERGIYFATSPDCIFYYRCENRFFRTQVCFPWQRFDIHTLRCRRRLEVDCNPMYAGIWRPLFGDRPELEVGEIEGGEIGIGGESLDEATGDNPSEQGVENFEIAGESPFGQEIPEESEITGQEEVGNTAENPSIVENQTNESSAPEEMPETEEKSPLTKQPISQETAANEESFASEQRAMKIENQTSSKLENPALEENHIHEVGSESGEKRLDTQEADKSSAAEKATIDSSITETPINRSSIGDTNSVTRDGSTELTDDKNSQTQQQKSIQEMLTKNDSSEDGNSMAKPENLENPDTSAIGENVNQSLSAIQTQNKEQILANNNSDLREILPPTEESLPAEKENSENKEPPEMAEVTDIERNSSSTTPDGPSKEKLSENVIVSEETSGPGVPATVIEVKNPSGGNIEFEVESLTLEEAFQGDSSAGEKGLEIHHRIGEKGVTAGEKTDVNEKALLLSKNSLELENLEKSLTTVKSVNDKDSNNSQEKSAIAEKGSVEKFACGEDNDNKIIFPESDTSFQIMSNEDDNSNDELSLRDPISATNHSSAEESLLQNTNSAQPLQDTEIGSTGKIWYWCGSGRFVLAQNSEEGDSICLQLRDPESINEESSDQAGGDWAGHTFLGTNDEFA